MYDASVKHMDIHVSGTVQGVFFRDSTLQKAVSLGLTGFVRNEDDGRVYIEVEGDDQKLGEFIEWCHRGPPSAQVERVDIAESVLKNFQDFKIHVNIDA